MSAIQELDRRYIARTYGRFPVTFVRGEGSALYDEAGRRYLDMGSGIAVNVLGYGDEGWVAAVTKQARTLAHASNLYYTEPQVQLAQTLCERSGMKRAFFGNSGAEANECLLKAARKYSADRYGDEKRPVVITLQNSFHGRTLATLAATGQDVFHHSFGPFPQGFRYAAPNDLQQMERMLAADDVCAVLVETVQGEGGVEPLDADYLNALRALTRERDVLLLVDEVQTGNGRTGKLFSYQHFDWLPDAVSTAKGLAGGLPMGVCLLGDKLCDTLGASSHGSTFGGNPVCAAAACYVQSRLTDELLEQVARKGEYIVSELSACKGVAGVSGRGLMLGVECASDARALVEKLLSRGVVALTAKQKLRLLPPLTLSWDELAEAIGIIKEVIGA